MEQKWTLTEETWSDSRGLRRYVISDTEGGLFDIWARLDLVPKRIVEEHNALAGIKDVAGFMETVKISIEKAQDSLQDAIDSPTASQDSPFIHLSEALALFPTPEAGASDDRK